MRDARSRLDPGQVGMLRPTLDLPKKTDAMPHAQMIAKSDSEVGSSARSKGLKPQWFATRIRAGRPGPDS